MQAHFKGSRWAFPSPKRKGIQQERTHHEQMFANEISHRLFSLEYVAHKKKTFIHYKIGTIGYFLHPLFINSNVRKHS